MADASGQVVKALSDVTKPRLTNVSNFTRQVHHLCVWIQIKNLFGKKFDLFFLHLLLLVRINAVPLVTGKQGTSVKQGEIILREVCLGTADEHSQLFIGKEKKIYGKTSITIQDGEKCISMFLFPLLRYSVTLISSRFGQNFTVFCKFSNLFTAKQKTF